MTISQLDRLTKEDRERILADYPDFYERVCKATGKSTATVSRVFHGLIRRSPQVRAAIDKELKRIGVARAA